MVNYVLEKVNYVLDKLFGREDIFGYISSVKHTVESTIIRLEKLYELNGYYSQIDNIKKIYEELKTQEAENSAQMMEINNKPRNEMTEYEYRLLGELTTKGIDIMRRMIKCEDLIKDLKSGDIFIKPLSNYIENRQKIDAYLEKSESLKNSREIKNSPMLAITLQQIERNIIRIEGMEQELFGENLYLRLMLPPEYAKRFDKVEITR